MKIGRTVSGFDVNVDLKKRINSNNLMLCLGDSGNGKTTLLKNLAKEANQEGIPVIIPDTSESYVKSEIDDWENVLYVNVAKEGLPVDIFKPRTVFYDGEEQEEDNLKVASRIAGVLTETFNINGAVQKPVLAAAVKRYVCDDAVEKSIEGIVTELKKVEGIQAETLACKLEVLCDIPTPENTIDWDYIVDGGKICVFQLSFLDEPLRSLCSELIMSDFWAWIRKRNSKSDVFLVLDEISNFSFKAPYFLSHLREFRKFGIGAVLATQYMGGIRGKDANNLLNQAAIRMYFGIRDSKELTRVAKELDYEKYKKWIEIIKGLSVGECVFWGKIYYSGEVIEQKLVLKVPFIK